MINSPIKRFKSFFEELTGDQKTGFREYAYSRFGIKIPKFGPSRRALALSDHVMPEGTDSIKIPVMNPTMQEIHDHLTSNAVSYTHLDVYKRQQKLYHPDILKHISDPVSHNLLIDKANSKQYDTIFDHVINHGDSYYSYSRLADNPNFSEKHIHKAISSNLLKSNNSFAGSVLQHPKLSGDLLTSMVKDVYKRQILIFWENNRK